MFQLSRSCPLTGRDRLMGVMNAASHTEPGEGEQPKLYDELASWFHLLTAPADYAEEAAFYRSALIDACDAPPRTLLELGSGGGNNASHLKAHFEMTLVDRSPGMLDVSRGLNPQLEHIEGDMRTVRLDRLFDAVFVHDAVMYMTTEADLRAAMETAFVHCRPGGAALFAPDHVRENFRPTTKHGGHDGDGRSFRYLEWVWDPDPPTARTTWSLPTCCARRMARCASSRIGMSSACSVARPGYGSLGKWASSRGS